MTPKYNTNRESQLESSLSRILKKLSDVGSSMDAFRDKLTEISETTDAIYDAVSLKRDLSSPDNSFLDPYD